MLILHAADTPRLSVSGIIAETLVKIPVGNHIEIKGVTNMDNAMITANALRAQVSHVTPSGHTYRVRKTPTGTFRIFRVA